MTLLGCCDSFAQAPPPISFLASRTYPVGGWAISVAVGDLNGDGKLDLAVATGFPGPGKGVNVFFGQGDGTFQPGAEISLNSSLSYIAIVDLNEDGKPDLIATQLAGVYSERESPLSAGRT